MANHEDQMKKGSIYDFESDVSGVAGSLKVNKRGEMSYPIPTENAGLKLWEEQHSILNKACAYVLLSLGRASIEKGLSTDIPAWGADCFATFPNGVIVKLLNRNVLALRPIGYKDSPARGLVAAVSADQLGIPDECDFFLYLGSGPRRRGGNTPYTYPQNK